jgi:hypothetical protein
VKTFGEFVLLINILINLIFLKIIIVFINDKYCLIFIENPKSGSTTIYKALEKILGSNPRKNPEQAHQTCSEIEKEYPDKWKSYLKVSTYRDPYRRFCSAVNYPKHYTMVHTIQSKLF